MSQDKKTGQGWFGRLFSSAGVTAECRCPSCGHTEPHTRGTPCSSVKCPKCGTPMRGSRC